MAGLFISFEGVDGVGKTTQVERLRQYLESRGRTVVMTREPGGTPLGVALRKLLLHNVSSSNVSSGNVSDGASPDSGTAGNPLADIAPRAEALIFAADRAQHVAELIRPALDRGDVVITDRYLDSSLAYQAGGRELTPAEIRNLSLWATNGLLPVRTYLLDMDPSVSHTRLQHEADRMESAGDDFQNRTRRAFLDLASAEPDRFRVIDAAQSIDQVWSAIQSDIDDLLRTMHNMHDDRVNDDCSVHDVPSTHDDRSESR
ncbi:thymidylate kinase [Bifidobacterium tissieri]|uniref:Thymidylate kinase n=1 Tax=Bifidobacterium tissieri TaxID=1630162 RepID=A0A261FG02_9BIFI|nr:dTMP kinase [Bifidobacterium tissieri]OZG58111.1 thymidylate kinase [Bifidobacterium tissieri]